MQVANKWAKRSRNCQHLAERGIQHVTNTNKLFQYLPAQTKVLGKWSWSTVGKTELKILILGSFQNWFEESELTSLEIWHGRDRKCFNSLEPIADIPSWSPISLWVFIWEF